MPKTKAKISATGYEDLFSVRKRLKKQSSKETTVKDVEAPKPSSATDLRLRKSLKPNTASPIKLPEGSRVASDADKSEHLEILKQFDLDFQYGPCGGLTRLERWNRAEKLKKNPPLQVKDLIESHSDDVEYVQAIWHFYGMPI